MKVRARNGSGERTRRGFRPPTLQPKRANGPDGPDDAAGRHRAVAFVVVTVFVTPDAQAVVWVVVTVDMLLQWFNRSTRREVCTKWKEGRRWSVYGLLDTALTVRIEMVCCASISTRSNWMVLTDERGRCTEGKLSRKSPR